MGRLITAFLIVVVLIAAGGFYVIFGFRTETMDGMKGTIEKSYFRDTLMAERSYVGGQLNGVTKIFYSNGNLKSQWSFKDGKKHGPAVHYTSDGNVHYREKYEEGQKVLRRTYDDSGKMIKEQKFEVG